MQTRRFVGLTCQVFLRGSVFSCDLWGGTWSRERRYFTCIPVSCQPLYNSDESFSKCLQDGCVNENAIDRVDVLALVAEKTGNKTIRYWAGANFNVVLIMARTHFNHPLMYLRATEPEYCLSWWLEHLDCDQHSKRIYDTNYSRLTPHDRNKFSAYDWFTNSENLKW